MRVIFLPVDERFCTRDYLLLLARAASVSVLTPPREMLGVKKIPADVDALQRWVLEKVVPGDILLLSLDMWVHGGLIPSRINKLELQTLIGSVNRLEQIKRKGAQIYMGATVTRIPSYDSSDEEPEYWEYFGKQMQKLTSAVATKLVGSQAEKDSETAYLAEGLLKDRDISSSLTAGIPDWAIKDYFWRRKRNFDLLQIVLRKVQEGVVDFLNLTLDDHGDHSLSVWEGNQHQNLCQKMSIEARVSIHPGADEALLSMLSRVLCDSYQFHPTTEVVYFQPEYQDLIPPYEGIPLSESMTHHIECAGGKVAKGPPKGLSSCIDARILVHNPSGEDWVESPDQNISLPHTRSFGKWDQFLSDSSIPTGIADIKYPNGSDHAWIEYLLSEDRPWLTLNCSGWNTPGNTIGTVCTHTFIQALGTKGYLKISEEKMRKAQAIFFLEHWGYQAHVRKALRKEAPDHGCSLWTLIPDEGWAKTYTQQALAPFRERIEKALKVEMNEPLYFPWHRSFEVAWDIDCVG